MSRDRTKWAVLRNRVSWLLILLLVPSLIIFFNASGQAPLGEPGGIAGTLFGKRVAWERFATHQTWLRQKWQEQLSQVPSQLVEPLLERQTWERLMLLEEAKRRRLRVDDQELVARLRQFPEFQEQGRFVADRYHRLLRAVGTSPQVFESLLRDDLLITKLVNAVKASVSVTEDEVRAAYTEARERLSATLILVEPGPFRDQAAGALTEQDLRAHYEASAGHFRTPEQLAFEWIGATREGLASAMEPSEEEVRAFYDAHPEPWTRPDGSVQPFEEAREAARQALGNDRARKQLTTLALELEDDRDAHLRFEEIALTHGWTPAALGPIPADDPWIPQGPEPAVLQAVAGLPEGTLSDLIETSNGVYLARVTQRIPSSVPPFEEVRDKVVEELVTERTRGEAARTASALRARLEEFRAAGHGMEEALADHTAAIHKVSFTRTEPIEPIGAVPEVNRQAFATALGALTDALETPTGVVILRPDERLPADESAFEGERERLREEALTKKHAARLEETLSDLRTRAKLQSFLKPSPSPP